MVAVHAICSISTINYETSCVFTNVQPLVTIVTRIMYYRLVKVCSLLCIICTGTHGSVHVLAIVVTIVWCQIFEEHNFRGLASQNFCRIDFYRWGEASDLLSEFLSQPELE